MPQNDFVNFLQTNQPTGNATETVVATSRTASSPFAGAQFAITFAGQFTAGAGTTATTFRVRRDSLTGTLVQNFSALTIAATNVVMVTFSVIDSFAGDVANQLWVLTAQQTGGTGAGGFQNAYSSITVPC